MAGLHILRNGPALHRKRSLAARAAWLKRRGYGGGWGHAGGALCEVG